MPRNSTSSSSDKQRNERRYYPPVIILVTDGEPTDKNSGFERGLQRLLSHELGQIATRIAVAIDVGPKGMDYLRQFSDIILYAENADEIAQNIVIASTSGIMISSVPARKPLQGCGRRRLPQAATSGNRKHGNEPIGTSQPSVLLPRKAAPARLVATTERSHVTLLQPGEIVLPHGGGSPIRIEAYLGSGKQGEVYAAVQDGAPIAVKWYKPDWIASDTTLRERVEKTVKLKAPNSRFLWPQGIVVSAAHPTFGYVMPLREPRFHEFRELICDNVQASFRALATAGLEAAESYQKLHLMGLCYIDISPGNIALDPETGEVRISDCDNVNVNGRGSTVATHGTEGFMAPEIVQQKAYPTRWTDQWSFAVLLFWAFMRNHPLQGRREFEHAVITKELELRLWGDEALFIYDDIDRSNRPVEGFNSAVLFYWPLYPQFLRDLFTGAFTRGIRQPEQRIMETQWRTAMAQLRDSIVPCPQCEAENFFDAAAGQHCWNCARELPQPRRIAVHDYAIVAADGAGLFSHHLDPRRNPDSQGPIAHVARNPRNADMTELRNASGMAWRATLPDGNERTVESGDCVGLEPGLRISIGNVEAEIL